MLIDKRQYYSSGTIEALNQFSFHTRTTPTDTLDLRCEYAVPRFLDLNSLSDKQGVKKPVFTPKEEQDNFIWFHTQHDFNTPCSPQLEEYLRKKILSLSKFPSEHPLSIKEHKRKSSGKLNMKSQRVNQPKQISQTAHVQV